MLLPRVMKVQAAPSFELLNQVCGTMLSKSSQMPALPSGSSQGGSGSTSSGSSRAGAVGWAGLAAGAALATTLVLL